jgi:hypothetical protein
LLTEISMCIIGHAQEFMKAKKFDEAHELLKRVRKSAAEMISEGESQIELG